MATGAAVCGGALCGAVVVPFMCGLPDGELASASAAPVVPAAMMRTPAPPRIQRMRTARCRGVGCVSAVTHGV